MYKSANANINFSILFFALLILFSACKKSDKKMIVGKWQNEMDWFEYFENGTYDSGKDFLTIVQGYQYSIDENKHELNMYTNQSDKSYYLKYKFIGEDTLSVRNSLSTDTTMIKFYRVIENKKEE
jgi:hypothetical protein